MKRQKIDLDHYRHLRVILRKHHNAVVETIPRTLLRKCARKLKLLEQNKLALESESELTILIDYCIYSPRERGKSLVQKYLAHLPATDDTDEQQVRAAMDQDRFSMYRIEQVRKGAGDTVRDLVRGGTLFVVDEFLSQTMQKGRIFGGRLIPFSDYCITTGAAFPMDDGTVAVAEGVFLSALKFTEGKLAELSPEANEELATVVIGAALQEGTTADIEYR